MLLLNILLYYLILIPIMNKVALFISLITTLSIAAIGLNYYYQLPEDLDCGLSSDFISFLNSNGYSSYDFNRADIKCGAYGGKASSSDKINKIPVIFIHGNSDVGFGRGTTDGYKYWQTGFRSLATYLTSQGYSKAQLYTTTWGTAVDSNANNVYHSKEVILRIRKFVEAVLAYTGAQQINVIGHSMGVTIGRKVLKGGSGNDHSAGSYNVGNSLQKYVKNFIGLAGANLGLTACWTATIYPTCGSTDGFFPGLTAASGPSAYLKDLNQNGGKQASNVYTIWSQYDDLIGYECVVWGKITSRIEGQDSEIKKTTFEWNHFAVRDNTGPDLINWL